MYLHMIIYYVFNIIVILWWQLTDELEKMFEKLKLTESLLDSKVYIL